jgi:hypothetical protein
VSMTLISTITVGSGGASNINFSSIPQTYTDIQLVWSTVDNRSAWDSWVFVTLNGSTTGYSMRTLYGEGSSTATATNIGGTSSFYILQNGTATANTFSSSSIYIPNYTSNTNKICTNDAVGEQNSINGYSSISALQWSNTAAITSITITPGNNPFLQNSSASLYGILKGSGGATVS